MQIGLDRGTVAQRGKKGKNMLLMPDWYKRHNRLQRSSYFIILLLGNKTKEPTEGVQGTE